MTTTLMLNPEKPEVGPITSATTVPSATSATRPTTDESPYETVARLLRGGLTAARVQEIAELLSTSRVELLRRRAVENAESPDYDDGEDVLAERAETTRAAHASQLAVIEGTESDDE